MFVFPVTVEHQRDDGQHQQQRARHDRQYLGRVRCENGTVSERKRGRDERRTGRSVNRLVSAQKASSSGPRIKYEYEKLSVAVNNVRGTRSLTKIPNTQTPLNPGLCVREGIERFCKREDRSIFIRRVRPRSNGNSQARLHGRRPTGKKRNRRANIADSFLFLDHLSDEL